MNVWIVNEPVKKNYPSLMKQVFGVAASLRACNPVMEIMQKKEMSDWRLAAAGVRDFNVPRRTPDHPTKSHVVVAKVGSRVKLIRFGQQGVQGAGRPSPRWRRGVVYTIDLPELLYVQRTASPSSFTDDGSRSRCLVSFAIISQSSAEVITPLHITSTRASA